MITLSELKLNTDGQMMLKNVNTILSPTDMSSSSCNSRPRLSDELGDCVLFAEQIKSVRLYKEVRVRCTLINKPFVSQIMARLMRDFRERSLFDCSARLASESSASFVLYGNPRRSQSTSASRGAATLEFTRALHVTYSQSAGSSVCARLHILIISFLFFRSPTGTRQVLSLEALGSEGFSLRKVSSWLGSKPEFCVEALIDVNLRECQQSRQTKYNVYTKSPLLVNVEP